MGQTEERLIKLETKMLNQQKEVAQLRDKSQEFEVTGAHIIATLDSIKHTIDEQHVRFVDHMKQEEVAMKGIHEHLRNLNDDLIESFKMRDEKITVLRINQAKIDTKLLLYSGTVLTVVTIVVQLALKVWGG